ncbi:MAG: hypothetical protein N2512_05780, partial [Armatimonadetes bacterium]|nr:hypothetical protein [Armatimonadota bacterium]
MALDQVEKLRDADSGRCFLARMLTRAEAWRRAGWWVAVCATAWAMAACGVCVAGIAMGWGLRVSLSSARELFFGAAVAASLTALSVFLLPWRRGPAAAGAQGLLLSSDDDLLTAAEAIDGRAFVSPALGRLLYARAIANLSGLRLPQMALLAPWRPAKAAIVAAVVLLIVSVAVPGTWEQPILEVSLPIQPPPAVQPAPLPAPSLISFSLHVEPPAYTARPAFDLLRPAGFQAPAGSRLCIRASFADCREAAVVLGSAKRVAIGDAGAEVTLSKTLRWGLWAAGPGGEARLGPFTAVATPDARPKV